MISVTASRGHVSACNAGAMASPAGAPPRRPSKPGTTHHQGNGRRPLNRATKGFSTWMNFCILSAPEVGGFQVGCGDMRFLAALGMTSPPILVD